MSPNETPNEPVKTESKAANKKGTLSSKLMGCGLIVAVILAVMIAVGLNVNNIARFGFGSNINNLGAKLENERFLTQEQYDELKKDLGQLRDFVQNSPMNKDNVTKYRAISEAFGAALEDNRIDDIEFGNIRSIMRDANLEFKRRSEADVKSVPEPRKK